MADMRDIEADLDSYVLGETWPDEGPAGEPIPPTTVEAAERIMRRLHSLRQELAFHDTVAKAEHSKTDAWFADRTAGIVKEIEWGEKALEPFARQWIPTIKGRKKSWAGPNGTLKLAKPSESLVVTTPEAFVRWAWDSSPLPDETTVKAALEGFFRDGMVRVKAEAVADAVKAVVTRTGEYEPFEGDPTGRRVRAQLVVIDEIIPGVVFERDAEDKFSVVLAEAIDNG